ncbi:beta strand repeat-containing protein, partial [Acinetobacter sichuanensis]
MSGPFTTNGNTYNTIAEAIADQAKKSKTTVTQGENIVVTSGTNADGSANYQVATAKDVKFDKVTVGNVVTDGTTGKISGLTAGDVSASSTDAINGSQLNAAQGSTSSIIGGGVTNNAGNLSGPFTTNGSSYNTIAEAIADQAKKSKTTVTQGENIVVTSGTNADGSANYQVATAKDVKFDKVTVGNVVTNGATGKISGLTAGNVSASSTDAINGSQLNAQGEGVKNIIGGSTTYNPSTGELTNTNIGGTGESTIDDAIKNVNTAATKAKTTVTQGNNIVVTSGTNADGSVNYEVATAKDVNFDKVTVGNVVTDGATGKISGLTDGTVAAGSTEAVTGNQLNTTAQSTGDLIGGGVTNTAGSLSGPFNANGSSYNTIADAITDQAKKSKTTVTQGDNIVVTSGTNADGSVNYEVATAKDVNFDKVTVGNVVTDGTTGKISGLTDGTVAAGSTEAVTGNQLNTTAQSTGDLIGGGVTNTAGSLSGPFNANGSSYNTIADAITDQAKKSKTTVTQGDNIVVTSATNADGLTNYEVATAKDVNFDKVTVGNVVTDGATGKISGLTDGTVAAGSTEAVTGSQLNTTAQSTGDLIGGGVTNNAGSLTGPFNANGSSYNTIADAITDQAKKSKTTVTQGDNIVVTSGTNADGSVNYEVVTAKDVNFDKVTSGDSTTGKYSKLTETGLAVNDGINKSTVDAGSISVTDGTNTLALDAAKGTLEGLTNTTLGGTSFAQDGRAATEEQLSAAQDSTSTIIGGGVTNNAGSLTGPFTTNGSSYNTIADAITDQAKKSKTTVTQGDNIVVTSATNADGSTNYEVATAKDVNFDKVTVGNVVTDGATGKISGLTDGTVAAGSTEAVTGNQLNTTAQSTGDIIGGGVTNN